MSLRAALYRCLSDAYFYIKRCRVPQIWRFLEDSQWWSHEQVREFQNEKLREIIRYVHEHVPYYRRIMKEMRLKPKDIQTVNDLVKIPILTKESFRNNWEKLISDETNLSNIRIRRTGGTTGEPLQIAKDCLNDAWERGAFRRGLGFSGYREGERMVKLFGGTLGLAPEGVGSIFKTKLRGRTFIPAFEISRNNIENYAKSIKQSKAKFLVGYASAVYLLAKLVEEVGIESSLQAVFPTAETLYEFQREYIEKILQCEIFEYYGCGEINSIAFECEAHNGLHVSDEHVILEVLKDGKRVPEGKMGTVTLTTLHNYTMPLIRYQNDDVVAISSEPCSCGRKLSRITRIFGRTNDLLLAKDDRMISGAFIPHLFRATKGIQQIQLIQETENLIRLKIVKGSEFSEEELKVRLKTIREYLGDVEIEVEYVDSIPITSQGKLRFVISKVAERQI